MLRCVITLAAVAVVTIQAHAQNTYQAQQFRVDSCKAIGFRANNALKYREAKEAYPMHTLSDTPMRVIEEWTVNYAMNGAGSAKEAIEVSFMKCMDNIDRVYRDARRGTKTSEADLQ